MQKCWPMWFQITNLPQKVTCLENWPTSILTTYWAPPFYSISNKSLYKLHNFGSNWAQIAHFSKIYFLEKLTIIFVWLLCPILQQHFKKNLREEIIRQGCIILACPCPTTKGNLLKKLTNIALIFYILRCYMIWNKSWGSRSKGCIIFAQIAPCCKREFSWKIEMSNYWTPLC